MSKPFENIYNFVDLCDKVEIERKKSNSSNQNYNFE